MKSIVLIPILLVVVLVMAEATERPIPKVILTGECEAELAPHGQGNVYAPDVHFEDGKFRMWYGGQGRDGHDRISLAESADGETWVRRGVVLQNDKANHVNDPSVVKVNGTYFMYYTHAEKDVVDRIDVAVSSDGVKWEPKGVALAPGSEGEWDALSVGRPAVVYEDGLFKMWYDGRKDLPLNAPAQGVPKSETSHRSVGYATSTDGLRWVRHKADPVFGQNAGAVDVKRVGSKLVMLYESGEGTRLATSDDGVSWRDVGFLLRKSGKDLDDYGHVTPCLLHVPAKESYYLYFGAAGARTWDHNRIAVVPFAEKTLMHLIESGR